MEKNRSAALKAGFVFLSMVLLFGCGPRVERLEQVSGALSGHDVSSEVRVVHDRHGFPHIMAEHDGDIYYALGYLMAQDRFLQLDVLRRAGRGELTELFGRIRVGDIDIIDADRVMRSLNYKGRAETAWKNTPDEAREVLIRFTEGINRYLDEAGHTIPQYRRVFRTRPMHWRPEDSLVCADIFGLAMTGQALGYDFYYSKLHRQFGEEKSRIFLREYPEDAPVIIEDIAGGAGNEKSVEHTARVMVALGRLFSGHGSNNWAVAPKKSASGSAIIANDPHVPVIIADFWYKCHLKGDGYDILGMMFPGYPAFGAAHNGEIAWATTNAAVDHMDIFQEQVNPDNPDQYLYKGEWQDFKVREEWIPRKRRKPVKVEIIESVHGPIPLEFTTYGKEDAVYSIRLVDAEPGIALQGYLDMARADNWNEFIEGVEDMMLSPFAWNHVYADKKGNIGYWLSGQVPIRPDNQGVLVREGASGDQDWQGYVPLTELPHIYNPKKAYIATANNKNWLPGYDYYIGFAYTVERAQRIVEVLESKDRFSREDMQDLQMDVVVVPARKYVPIILSDLEGSKDKRIRKGVRALEEWRESGYEATIDSAGTPVYVMLLSELTKVTFKDDLGEGPIGETIGVWKIGLDHIIDNVNSPWFDDVNTDETEARKDMMERAMMTVVKELERELGRDESAWQWGDLQHTYIGTVMGYVPVIGKRHLAAKYPREGMGGTVNNSMSFALGPLNYVAIGGPTTRMVVDFADPGRFWFTSITGNSENPRSGRMANTSEAWVKGDYQVFSMYEDEYEDGAMGTLVFRP